jgi:hypothetical protein
MNKLIKKYKCEESDYLKRSIRGINLYLPIPGILVSDYDSLKKFCQEYKNIMLSIRRKENKGKMTIKAYQVFNFILNECIAEIVNRTIKMWYFDEESRNKIENLKKIEMVF